MAIVVDELFTKRLPVRIKCQDRDDRKSHVEVAVELHTQTTPVHQKELVVRITDESDLFFLYTLRLKEEDYQSLKVQQGLLVDFGAFPQRFIDLLHMCLAEEHKEVPKFILELISNGTSGSCTANLNVIETNPFKHLTHLSIKFIPGTDSDIKKFLADCLKTLKDQNSTLHQKLQMTEGDLSGQLRQAREALTSRTVELDNLKAEWSTKSSELLILHRQEMTEEREKNLQTHSNFQQRVEQEKRESEAGHEKLTKQTDARLWELETANKELTDLKYKSEATIRELNTKRNTVEEENLRMKQDLNSLRKNNASLDGDYHEQDKLINQLKTRLAVFEQEVKDKEQVLQKTSDLLVTEQDHKRKSEDDLERKKRHIGKLESSVKTMSEELVKGNEIIKKLQGDIKTYHTKLKLRSQVTTEQEKLLLEKNNEMETIRKDLGQASTALRNKDEENNKLNENLESTVQKLEESRQLLKTNENVINWLNKQVTEQQLHQQHRPTAGTFELNSTASTGMSQQHFRPPNAIHNYSAPSYGGMSSRLSTSGTSQQSAAPARPQPQVQYQAGGSKLPMPLAKSSPIAAIAEENRPAQQAASSVHLQQQVQPGDVMLDKYLQKTSEQPLRSTSANSHSPTTTSLHFHHGSTTNRLATTSRPASSASNPTRLSRELITGQVHVAKNQPTASKASSQPPLASAYFPNKVT